jgi:hypothetical protein
VPTACIRWSPGRVQSWRRPEDGGFTSSRYDVTDLDETAAKNYVTSRHYSGTYPAAAQRYGLLGVAGEKPRLVGVAVLSIPPQARVLTQVFPGLRPYAESLELGRLVIEDEVPANGESWFVAQVFRLAVLRGIRGVVSFSDPVPRAAADGTMITPGHVGIIYQALNAVYTGRGTERSLIVLPGGAVFSARAAQKIRSCDQGHEYAERLLIAHGARPIRAGERPGSWLAEALSDIRATRVRHRGCHRYAFRLGARRARAQVRVALPGQSYPKVPDLDEIETAG